MNLAQRRMMEVAMQHVKMTNEDLILKNDGAQDKIEASYEELVSKLRVLDFDSQVKLSLLVHTTD